MDEKVHDEVTKQIVLSDTLGKLSLIAYLLGTSVTIWSFFPEFHNVPATIHIVIVFALGFGIDKNHYDVWWRAALLGCILSFGIILSSNYVARGLFFSLGWYIIFMSLFHYLEYLVTGLTNPLNLSTDSFILNHSVAYGIAAAASMVEFFLEIWMFPWMKQCLLISSIGAVGCCLGDTLRKLAMFHAGTNFNHLVQDYKHDDHELVTSGVFSYFRHPSYVGWFYWSLSTQLILCNPICFVAYGIASWHFFNERVYIEEFTLLNFFGADYVKYQREVGTGLPFIKGMVVTEEKKA